MIDVLCGIKYLVFNNKLVKVRSKLRWRNILLIINKINVNSEPTTRYQICHLSTFVLDWGVVQSGLVWSGLGWLEDKAGMRKTIAVVLWTSFGQVETSRTWGNNRGNTTNYSLLSRRKVELGILQRNSALSSERKMRKYKRLTYNWETKRMP